MHGLSVWKANSSELNLFSPSFDWLLVLTLYRGAFFIGMTAPRLPHSLQSSPQTKDSAYITQNLFSSSTRTPITPLYWCCKSTRTMWRGTITQAGTIIHIKHEPQEQWIRHWWEKKVLSSSSYLLCLSSSSLFNFYIFIILFLTLQTQCQNKSTRQTFSFSGRVPYMAIRCLH